MSKSLTAVINEHNERVIKDAFFEGAQYGLELGRRILNNIKVESKQQETEQRLAVEKLIEKWNLKEDKPNEE